MAWLIKSKILSDLISDTHSNGRVHEMFCSGKRFMCMRLFDGNTAAGSASGGSFEKKT